MKFLTELWESMFLTDQSVFSFLRSLRLRVQFSRSCAIFLCDHWSTLLESIRVKYMVEAIWWMRKCWNSESQSVWVSLNLIMMMAAHENLSTNYWMFSTMASRNVLCSNYAWRLWCYRVLMQSVWVETSDGMKFGDRAIILVLL